VVSSEIDIRNDVVYAQHDGVDLQGDLYAPKAPGSYPTLVTVHGGGWERGQRSNHQYWGHYLAARGYVVFAVTYRRSKRGVKSYPAAVTDVRAAVQYVKGNAAALKVDAARICLMGDSAGAHLAALVALAGDDPRFAGAYPQDPHASLSSSVKVLIGNYGVYDLAAHWEHELLAMPGASATEQFLGVSLLDDRKTYFEASPMSYVTIANNATAVFLTFGTEDDVVDRKRNSEAFLAALKRARYYVRTVVVQGTGHYWASEPIEEPGSSSGYLAPRLVRFLAERL
jgi:acetyl esterase/lipase